MAPLAFNLFKRSGFYFFSERTFRASWIIPENDERNLPPQIWLVKVTPFRNKGSIRHYWGKPMVNKPLVFSAFFFFVIFYRLYHVANHHQIPPFVEKSFWNWFSKHQTSKSKILLTEEILHQLIESLSHCLQGFVHPRWCRISSIHSNTGFNQLWMVEKSYKEIH